jgi:hypothetical protein
MALFLESLHAHDELPPTEELLIQPMQIEA